MERVVRWFSALCSAYHQQGASLRFERGTNRSRLGVTNGRDGEGTSVEGLSSRRSQADWCHYSGRPTLCCGSDESSVEVDHG